MQKRLLMRLLSLLIFATAASTSAQIPTGPLPQHDGEMSVDGLNAPVEIYRDQWGVPHIYASNTHDLLFAQGFTQAQDRWWQMELFRHIGSGALQELTGQNAALMGQDLFMRTLGLRHVAQQEVESAGPQISAMLQAFADGVNAYILNRPADELAFEYGALRLGGVTVELQPWTPVDTLVWGKVMALNLSGNRGAELTRSQLFEAIDPEMIADFAPQWPFAERPTILRIDDLDLEATAGSASVTAVAGIVGLDTQFAGNFAADSFEDTGIGSNNWVVSGAMSATGMPLLANDTHLGIQMPSIWYEVGLHCQPVSDACPLNVTGFALSTAPAILIGHNDHIAWGVTNLGPDTQDLYRISVDPDNPLQYEFNGEMRDMILREETLNFGDGAESIVVQVRETHFGPIINDHQIDPETGEMTGFENENPLALRWTALEPGSLFNSVLLLNQASNWDEFRQALSFWDVPSQNFVYADVEGNIGYQSPGRIPIRAAAHSGLLPVDGSTDAFEWQGFIPFDRLPRAFNPARDFIATANQAVVPLEYYDALAAELGAGRNYLLSQEWAYGYRAQRIEDRLLADAPHSVATFRAIQADNFYLSAQELMPFLSALEFDDPALTDARDWLLDWDYQLHMDSPHAALYMQFWASLVRGLYDDQTGAVTSASGGPQNQWATLQLAQDPHNVWWDDATTADIIESRDEVLARAFAAGFANTQQALGKDRAAWRWGDLHTATFVNAPLGQSGIALVENIVNRGPVAVSGGSGTVNATNWSARSDGFGVGSLSSQRMIVDLADLGNSLTMHTTGQSSNPGSPNYDDMIDPWRNIEYHPMLWTRAQVEAAAVSTLILNPVG